MIVSYCEGDVTIHTCDTDEEFVEQLSSIDTWNVKQGYSNARIDAGFDLEMEAAFERIGLADMVH